MQYVQLCADKPCFVGLLTCMIYITAGYLEGLGDGPSPTFEVGDGPCIRPSIFLELGYC